MALPIWIEFMKAHIAESELSVGFVPPANIVVRSVNPMTGEVTEPWVSGAIQEVFIVGTAPGTPFRP